MVTLQFHLDGAEKEDAFWWVTSPDMPSLYVTSTELAKCTQNAIRVLDLAEIDVSDVRFVLADYGMQFN